MLASTAFRRLMRDQCFPVHHSSRAPDLHGRWLGNKNVSFFVSWLELAMMKRSGGLRESCSTSPRRSPRLHSPSPRPENPDQDSGTIEALQPALSGPC
jgi:hypothetical protein